MKRLAGAVMVLMGLGLGQPVQAETAEGMVTARDPKAMAETLTTMGFLPELTRDSVGDPMIRSRERWGVFTVLFSGCDAETHENCEAIRLQIGFDREEPWNAKDALALGNELPFLSVRLDPEGDPFLHWDLFLGEGISEAVFVRNVAIFRESVLRAYEIVFAEELAAQRSQAE